MVRLRAAAKPLAPRGVPRRFSLVQDLASRLSASWLCQDEDSLFIAQDLGEVKRENGENAGLKCGGKHGIIKNKIAKENGEPTWKRHLPAQILRSSRVWPCC